MDNQEPRWDLVRRLRKQIADGTYDVDAKLRIAVDRAMGEVSRSPHDEDEAWKRNLGPELDL